MATTPQYTHDIVVIGSGGAAFATALGAVDSGLDGIMVESTDKWGGSTSMSGGGMWLPNNPLMRRDNVADSRESALTYMEKTIGDEGPATSRARKEAFVDGVDDFVITAERHGMRFARAKDYPDYYPELPGGMIGRAIEPVPFDAKNLGSFGDHQRVSMAVPIMTNDVWLLGRAWSTISGAARGAQVLGRVTKGLITGKKLMGIGAGLMGQFGQAVIVCAGVPLWMNTQVNELLIDEGKVRGVRVSRDGTTIDLIARKGVMIASGGFDHNTQWRQRYQHVHGYSSGNPGNLGGGIELGRSAGAALALMDDAWWGASLAPIEGSDPSFIVGERSLPYCIIVDSRGKRIANEAESYVDLGHHMLEHDREGTYWFILDIRHRMRYMRTFGLDPKATKAQKEQSILHEGKTLPELATRIGVDQATFKQTIERFNSLVRSGRDQDFGKGESAYDRYYGDPTVHPNPCLGTVEKGPFLAYRIVAGDLGTKGGIVTDADGRALRVDGSVIEGLYAAGNCSASVMGRTYPGPGSTIGPAVVFGLRAARHMAASRG